MNENAKTLILDATTEHCEVTASFSERDIFEETRLQLEGIDAFRYVPEYDSGELDEESAINKIMNSMLETGKWTDNEDEYEAEFEVRYTENYPLYDSPAITVKYWAMDNCLDRWTTVCISLPEK